MFCGWPLQVAGMSRRQGWVSDVGYEVKKQG